MTLESNLFHGSSRTCLGMLHSNIKHPNDITEIEILDAPSHLQLYIVTSLGHNELKKGIEILHLIWCLIPSPTNKIV